MTAGLEGAAVERAEQVEDHRLGAWTALVFSILLLVLTLTRTVSFLRSDDYILRREHWCAVRTTLVLLCLAAMVAWPNFLLNAQEWVPGIRGIYPWLGFWLLGNCKCYAGAYLKDALHSFVGALAMIGFMFFLHVVMPGGAGHTKRDIVIFGGALMPGGYRQASTIALGMIFTYLVQLANWNSTTKGFCLALLSETILNFMNPDREIEREIFYGVLIDTEVQFNWRGPVMLSFYSIAAAVVLGALALPLFRPWRAVSREWVSSQSQCAIWYREIAVDTMGVLSHLIENLTTSRAGTSRKFDYTAAVAEIRKLGVRRAQADALLTYAEWEVLGRASLRRSVSEMKRFSALLRDMRQVLRLLSEQCASSDRLHGFQDLDVAGLLVDFQVSCVEALEALLQNKCCKECSVEHRRTESLAVADQADKTLVAALVRLRSLSLEEHEMYTLELSIIDNLRRWPAAVAQVLNVKGDMVRMSKHKLTWHWQHLIPTREQTCTVEKHLDALRLLTAWTTGLFWCIYRRNFASSCLMNVAFLFSPSVGSMREMSINRIVGVSLGIVFGNLPATFLMYGAGGTKLPRFTDLPPYLLTYLILSAVALLVSTHGYITTASKMSTSYYLWAGFMISIQITHLQHEYMDERLDMSASLFMIVMDNFMACLILLVTDMVYARFVTGTTVERASWSLASGFDSASAIVLAIGEGRIEDAHEHTSQLDWHIKTARYWDAEAAKEDPLLMPDCAKRYDADMVSALLDQLDMIHIAARSYASSGERLEIEYGTAPGLFSQEVASLSVLYAEALRALLLGGTKRRKLVKRAAGKLMKNHTVNLDVEDEASKKLRRSESTAEAVMMALEAAEEMRAPMTTDLAESVAMSRPSKEVETATSQAARTAMVQACGIISAAMHEVHALVHACAVTRGKEEALASVDTFMGTTTRPFPRCDSSAVLTGPGRSRTSTKASISVSTKMDVENTDDDRAYSKPDAAMESVDEEVANATTLQASSSSPVVHL